LQGGAATAESYTKAAGRKPRIKLTKSGYKTSLKPADIPRLHQQFFQKQLLYFIDDENNCFVHAGFDRFSEFNNQSPERYYWDRDLWASALLYEMLKLYDPDAPPFQVGTTFNEIFIGHTSTTNWSIDKPMKAVNIHNVDTGAGHDGKLTIMDIHSKQFWQSDPIGNLYTEKKVFTW
jgi:serine/threonine protein phosphatase 1